MIVPSALKMGTIRVSVSWGFGKDWNGKIHIMHSTWHRVNAYLMLTIIIKVWHLSGQKMKYYEVIVMK